MYINLNTYCIVINFKLLPLELNGRCTLMENLKFKNDVWLLYFLLIPN